MSWITVWKTPRKRFPARPGGSSMEEDSCHSRAPGTTFAPGSMGGRITGKRNQRKRRRNGTSRGGHQRRMWRRCSGTIHSGIMMEARGGREERGTELRRVTRSSSRTFLRICNSLQIHNFLSEEDNHSVPAWGLNVEADPDAWQSQNCKSRDRSGRNKDTAGWGRKRYKINNRSKKSIPHRKSGTTCAGVTRTTLPTARTVRLRSLSARTLGSAIDVQSAWPVSRVTTKSAGQHNATSASSSGARSSMTAGTSVLYVRILTRLALQWSTRRAWQKIVSDWTTENDTCTCRKSTTWCVSFSRGTRSSFPTTCGTWTLRPSTR